MPTALLVRPFDDTSYPAWRDHSIAAYAAEKVEAGTWSAAEAVGQATLAFDSLLPLGPKTSAHSLRRVLRAEDEALVGWFWIGPASDAPPTLAWLFDIEVAIPFRGQGHGRSVLTLAEAEARSLGYARLGLHVFASNTVARTLYESAGFDLAGLNFVKPL